MMNLMVVDDEHSAVESIAASIPWREHGIGRVFKAYSVKEALQTMAEHSVHIIITDIRMPGLSGLDLVGHVRQRWEQVKCIILSGHASFDYAKQALKHGTVSYLLKPVRDEELIEAVQQASVQIRLEGEKRMMHQRAMYSVREHLPAKRAELMKDVLLGRRFADGELTAKLEQLEIGFRPQDKMQVLIVRYDDAQEAHQAFRLMKYAISNVVEEIFGGSYHLCHTEDAYDDLVFMVSPKQEGDDAELLLGRLGDRLIHSVRQYLNASISVSSSRMGRFPEHVPQLYLQAVSALRKQADAGKGLHLQATAEPRGTALKSLSSLYEPPALTTLLEAGRVDEAQRKIDGIFAELSGSVFPEHVYVAFHYLAAAFSYMAHREGRQLSEVLGEEYQQLLKDGYGVSLRSLDAWTKKVMLQWETSAQEDRQDNVPPLIRQVQQWIDRHLSEDLSLQVIAGEVHLHPVYLSKLYKQSTGEGISDYIMRSRMDRAVHLLKHTSMKIYEVGQEVGYNNTPYFIQVFRKHYGLTPQDFRNG
ncbi:MULTISPECIES: response regulator transcription factor [Paenibacillus]|uniref:response regulator transcription factor n=1 Tax=Paenibacillus TaxID=44249 RepID=UPI001F2DC12E|nr:response regulator [Paenibacillus sp. JJ-223]CAH1220698.1 HTH-type transcriptional activator RhaS [Paenibacillus sp. JJ-223]